MFGWSPLPRTLEAALRDVRHSRFEVRLSALRDLVRLATGADRERVLTALKSALESDEAPGIRAEAAVALADVGAKEHVSALLPRLADEHERVRQMALLALGELAEPGDPAALEAVRAVLADASPAIRFQALIALHRLLGAAASSALVEATRDADREVRHVAFRLLEELWTEPQGKSVPSVVMQRARAALRDDDGAVRLAAAILLARVGDPGGNALITAVINGRERIAYPEDEQVALELAGELGLEAARPGLLSRAFGLFGFSRHPFRWQACVALARLGDARAKKTILRGLRAWNRDERTLAVAAAGHARMVEAKAAIREMSSRPERADPSTVQEALALLEAAQGS